MKFLRENLDEIPEEISTRFQRGLHEIPERISPKFLRESPYYSWGKLHEIP